MLFPHKYFTISTKYRLATPFSGGWLIIISARDFLWPQRRTCKSEWGRNCLFSGVSPSWSLSSAALGFGVFCRWRGSRCHPERWPPRCLMENTVMRVVRCRKWLFFFNYLSEFWLFSLLLLINEPIWPTFAFFVNVFFRLNFPDWDP